MARQQDRIGGFVVLTLREEDVGGSLPMTRHRYTTISNDVIIVNVSIWDGTPVSFCDKESFERPLFASRR
jgi:hypothetical protein